MVYSKKIENHVMLSGEEKENGGKTTVGLIKPGFHMSGKSRTIDLGILLFPDCPKFCGLCRSVPDFCDGRQSFPTNENSNLYRRGRRRCISLVTNPLNCLAPVTQVSIFGALSISGQIHPENQRPTLGP